MVQLSIRKLSRGIRNNNPANIRHGKSKWFGSLPNQTDKSFVQFDTMSNGIRALIILLHNYYNLYHLDTIRKIINRYAPSSENNTSSYIAYCSSSLGILPDDELSLTDYGEHSHIFLLCKSICWMESNYALEYKEFLNSYPKKYPVE